MNDKYLTSSMDNVLAYRLGNIARSPQLHDPISIGDEIDRGLVLRKLLEEAGFGLVKLENPPKAIRKQSAEPTAEHAPEVDMTRLKELEEIEKRAEKMEAALEAISAWGDAYPLSVFPEPDFKRVHELLEAGEISLDAVSASNMRHVVDGVAKIARKGLGEDQEVKYAKIDG